MSRSSIQKRIRAREQHRPGFHSQQQRVTVSQRVVVNTCSGSVRDAERKQPLAKIALGLIDILEKQQKSRRKWWQR